MKRQTVKLFSVCFVILALLGTPVVLFAHNGEIAGRKIVETTVEDGTGSGSDSNTDSSNMKSRREQIKKDIEEMKSKSAAQREEAKEKVLAKVKQAALKAIDSTVNKLNNSFMIFLINFGFLFFPL